jgi:quinol-cytochrome oxidoreductase complex cytochrome b subunit
MDVKKYLLFAGSFVLAYIALQIASGMILTFFYEPGIPLGEAPPAQADFGYACLVPLLISLLSLSIAFGATKHFGKKTV